MPEKIFIGREHYLDTFKPMIRAGSGSPYILHLHGPGGIGKTKILQELARWCDNEKIPNTGIIDLYGFEMSSRLSAVEMKIADALSRFQEDDPFEKYRKIREEYKNKSPDERGGEYKHQFIKDLSAWSDRVVKDSGKRGVLIFDTLEEIRDTIVGSRLLSDWLPNLEKAVVVLSGRQTPEEIDFPPEIRKLITHMAVNKFSEDEAIDYLKGRTVWEAVKDEGIQNRLFELTEFKPLLLALSADWMMNFDFFPEIRLAELVEDADRESFERKLVQNLPRLAGEYSGAEVPPERLLMPAMAHLIEPLDKNMLEFLMPGFREADEALKNLNETSFVKGMPPENPTAYWFQDELRKLFHKHIFRLNPNEEEKWKRYRTDISKKMLEYYNKLMEKKTDKREMEGVKARKLFHEIFIDPEKGMKKFQKKFQAAREEYRYGFSSLLLSSVRFNFDDLNEGQKYHFRLQEGRWLRDRGLPRQAKKRFEELLEENPDDPSRTPYIYNALGAAAVNLGKYKKALEYHTKSLELSREHKPDRISIQEQALGEVHLMMGDMEKAVFWFKKAHRSAMKKSGENKKKDKNWNRIAGILLNIGKAYGFSGKYDVGIDYVNQAIEVFEKLKSKEPAAMARIIYWDIVRRKGQNEKTVEGITEALGQIDETNYGNRAQAFFHLGYAQWYRAVETDDPALLKKAKESFEECIDLSKKFDMLNELPRSLQEVSQVYWTLGQKEKARKANDEAYDRAAASHDIFYAVNALVKKAEFDYEDKEFQKIRGHAREMEEKFEKAGYTFPLFYGRMHRILGNVEFKEKNYDAAFKEYGKALLLIAEHGGYGKYTIDKELDRLDKKINQMRPDEQLELCWRLQTYWEEQGAESKYPELPAFVDRHLTRLALETGTGDD